MYQIVSTRTVNTQHGQSVVLSLQKAGELMVICVNWTENERDWKSVRFVSTTTVLIICKLFM